MTEDEAQIGTERALHLLDRHVGLAAGRTLEVPVLDEGDPGVGASLNVVPLAHRHGQLAHGRTGATLPDVGRPKCVSCWTSEWSSARTAATPSTPEAGPRVSRPDPDGDRFRGQRGEQVLVGPVVADRQDGRVRQPLGRERRDDASLVNPVGPDLDHAVPDQDLDRLVAEQLIEVEPQLVRAPRADLEVGQPIVPGEGHGLLLDERARRACRGIAQDGEHRLPPGAADLSRGNPGALLGARDQNPCSACSQIGSPPSQCSSASRPRPLTMWTSVYGRAASARSRESSSVSGRASSGVGVNGTSVPS